MPPYWEYPESMHIGDVDENDPILKSLNEEFKDELKKLEVE